MIVDDDQIVVLVDDVERDGLGPRGGVDRIGWVGTEALAESEQIRMFLLDLFENADPERAAGSVLTVDEM